MNQAVLLVKTGQLLEESLELVLSPPLVEDRLGLNKLLLAHNPLKGLGRADPFFIGVVMAGRLELLAGAVVDHRPLIRLVAETRRHTAGSPAAASGRGNAIGIETLGNAVLRVIQFDELVEDAADDGDLRRVAGHERDPLVLPFRWPGAKVWTGSRFSSSRSRFRP